METESRIDANAHEYQVGRAGTCLPDCRMCNGRIGHGLREKTYERVLCREFDLKGIKYSQQAVFPVE